LIFLFFEKTFSCKYTIKISTLVLHEATRFGLGEEIRRMVSILEKLNKIEVASITEDDQALALIIMQQAKTHRADALHIATAQRLGVKFIVTKNIRDFTFATQIPVRKPIDT
jgi:predicted nucleic acid-binding protein